MTVGKTRVRLKKGSLLPHNEVYCSMVLNQTSTFYDHVTEEMYLEQFSVPTRQFLQNCPDQKQNLFQHDLNSNNRKRRTKQSNLFSFLDYLFQEPCVTCFKW